MMGSSRKKHLKLLAAAIAAAIVLSSCASLQRFQDEGNLNRVATLINTGPSERLSEMSLTPFLLDQEIIALPADLSTFWENIAKAGFRVEGAVLARAFSIAADSYREFADTMEVRSFFSQYVKEGARILEMETSAGQRILLLGKSEWFAWKLQGFKGPY
jgi:hypothetical protein